MSKSFLRRCTCHACKAGLRWLKGSRDGARKWAKQKRYQRRLLRRRNSQNLRNGYYEHAMISIPYTD